MIYLIKSTLIIIQIKLNNGIIFKINMVIIKMNNMKMILLIIKLMFNNKMIKKQSN